MQKIRMGISGAGGFAECFIPLFKNHPQVASVTLAEVLPERRKKIAEKFGIEKTVTSHEELCQSDVDAIAIITQRHLHGPQAVMALESGKHVYCAVPAASSLEELRQLVDTVEKTGLMYMMGETSYYYPANIFCRDKFLKGEFGEFIYGEGEYLHDMSHGFYEAYQNSGGENWKRVAGFPPMYYPTHSTSMIISITGQKLTRVSCLGFTDKHEDGIFGIGKNNWDNPYSNQSALFRTSGGGCCRINEFRRIGHKAGNCVRTSIYGTHGCFEQQGDSHFWTDIDGGQKNLDEDFRCPVSTVDSAPDKEQLSGSEQEDFYSDISKVHPHYRLPAEFKTLVNGHYGSHQFLVDDFVRSVTQNRLAPNHVWAAASYTAPGLVAHQSALNEGQLLDIPDFGNPPEDAGMISYA